MSDIFIVGNKFREFCSNEGVITIAELSDMARTNNFERLVSGSRLVAGQGVREAELQAICDQAEHALAARQIDVASILRRQVRASRLHTHKHRLQNSIISQPQRLDEDRYESALLLDERSELMSDHQTGQHIQGMILIEAARQLFLAVTEEYFIGPEVHDRYYFVINSAEVRFKGFVFPVDATLRYDIVSKDVSNPARLRFETLTSVIQGGVCATEVAFGFTAFHAAKIETKERQQAQALLQTSRSARAVALADASSVRAAAAPQLPAAASLQAS